MHRSGIEAIPGMSGVGLALDIKPWIPSQWPEPYVDDDLAVAHSGISVSKSRSLYRGMRRVPPDGNPVAWDGRPHAVRVETG
jgi:hypothetical protein